MVTCSFGIICSSVMRSNSLLRAIHNRKRTEWGKFEIRGREPRYPYLMER
jgi:hypothetical protein